MAHKKSQWFLALLDVEQHVYEGYSARTLKQAIDRKLHDDDVTKEAHLGAYDYLWYYENVLLEEK